MFDNDTLRPVESDKVQMTKTKDADENCFATCRARHPATTGFPRVQLATLFRVLSLGANIGLTFTRTAVCAGLLTFGIQSAIARDQIYIVGSSTVVPFSTLVANKFSDTTNHPTPIIKPTHSSRSLMMLCAESISDRPDIAATSRRITPDEVSICTNNEVGEVIEAEIGVDSFVLAGATPGPDFSLTVQQISQALAAEVRVDGEMVSNPYRLWSEVDSSLPHKEIQIFGLSSDSRTRIAFDEIVMHKGVGSVPSAMGEDSAVLVPKGVRNRIRTDGRFVELSDTKFLLKHLEENNSALGVVNFGFLRQNETKLQAAKIDGVAPTIDTISSGSYGVSLPMYIYVNKARLENMEAIQGYLTEFTSERALGPNGYLTELGLIPRSEVEEFIRRPCPPWCVVPPP